MPKRLNSSSARTHDSAKRHRSSSPRDQQDEQPPPCPYPRLKAVRFPPEIQAIPYILKQIDVFLMTKDEALIEAAKTGDTEWLEGLAEQVDNDIIADAIVEASARGHVDCVEVLLEEYDAIVDPTAHTCWKRALNALEAAAINGHLEVLRVLLCNISPGSDSHSIAELCSTLHRALLDAAERGFLDVVKFVALHAKEQEHRYYDTLFRRSNALARAISGGQHAVVEHLLGMNEFTWDLQGAFVAAVKAGDRSLADRMYELYKLKPQKERLFVSLVCHGDLETVKYLYETGDNDADLIGEAFVKSAKWSGKEVLGFLLGTGRVSDEAFDKGFETAAVHSFWDPVNMVSFLLDKKRASSKSVNSAFVSARGTDVLKLLLDCGRILDESICAVFERETLSLGEHWNYSKEETGIRIIKLLYAKDCIPAEMIGKAFITAALKGHYMLLALLRGDGRISAGMVDEAFAAAATRKESDLMMSLYDANISAGAILAAFSNGAAGGRMENVKELAKLLSDGERVPQELKHKAFVIAAQVEHSSVLRTLCKSGYGFWPLATLQEALAVAKHDDVRNFIRSVICDQLFDPSLQGVVEIVAKAMENRTNDPPTRGYHACR